MRIGLVHCGEAPGFGYPRQRVVPIRLESSPRAREWMGRVEPDGEGWRVAAADLQVDALTGKRRLRPHSLAGQVGGLVRRERLDGLHAWGVEAAAVAAVAAVEEDVPLAVSFLDGEAELELHPHAPELKAALRACQGWTAPCEADARRVVRLLRPPLEGEVVPPRVSGCAVEAERVPVEGPVIGCFAEHGRASGLDLLLEAFARVGARRPAWLLLVGPFHSVETYIWSPVLDRHPLKERMLRYGEVGRERGLALMKGCEVAAFPLPVSAFAPRVLECAAAGARVLCTPVGALGETPGLRTLERNPDEWERVLLEMLDHPSEPPPIPVREDPWPDFHGRIFKACS